MKFKTFARELALLILGQITESEDDPLKSVSVDNLLQTAIDSLMQHWREQLDQCASKLEIANSLLFDHDRDCLEKNSENLIRENFTSFLQESEQILNSLSASIEFPRLFALSEEKEVRYDAMNRVSLVVEKRLDIDDQLDSVMEGWRLKRLPRIDRDILRLAVIDLFVLNTPLPVSCNEAVELANKYSDEQGRRMINGVLRRLQQDVSTKINK